MKSSGDSEVEEEAEPAEQLAVVAAEPPEPFVPAAAADPVVEPELEAASEPPEEPFSSPLDEAREVVAAPEPGSAQLSVVPDFTSSPVPTELETPSFAIGADRPAPPEPRRISKRSTSTGKRHSRTSGSVSREFVMWVWTASVPSKSGPAPEPPQIVS